MVARFTKSQWTTDRQGWNTVVCHLRIGASAYLRLRGTNNRMDSPEIDPLSPNGDPALDVPGTNTPEAAWADLWFYSNPIFVSVSPL